MISQEGVVGECHSHTLFIDPRKILRLLRHIHKQGQVLSGLQVFAFFQ